MSSITSAEVRHNLQQLLLDIASGALLPKTQQPVGRWPGGQPFVRFDQLMIGRTGSGVLRIELRLEDCLIWSCDLVDGIERSHSITVEGLRGTLDFDIA